MARPDPDDPIFWALTNEQKVLFFTIIMSKMIDLMPDFLGHNLLSEEDSCEY